jgi:hypothetical protein
LTVEPGRVATNNALGLVTPIAPRGRRSIGCRGAEYGLACTNERTGAVALREALESVVQLGRGDEVNRQAEMANTKCRDSLQPIAPRVRQGVANCQLHNNLAMKPMAMNPMAFLSVLDRITKPRYQGDSVRTRGLIFCSLTVNSRHVLAYRGIPLHHPRRFLAVFCR